MSNRDETVDSEEEPSQPVAQPARPEAEQPRTEPVGQETPGLHEPPGGRRRVRALALVALGVMGLAALGAGGFAVARELTRPPTTAEVKAAGEAETRLRWRFRPAGQIFPATVQYVNGLIDDTRTAHRIGIAPAAGCAQALDREVAQVVARHGCVTVLRATYADQSGTLLVTLGVVVMPDDDKADAAESALHETSERWGIRPAAFPGTVAERFGDPQRQLLSMQTNHSPYLFLSARGWADGRPKVKESDRAENFTFANEILTAVTGNLTPNERPCKTKEIRC